MSMAAQMAALLERRRARATRAFESKALRDAEGRLALRSRGFHDQLNQLARAVRPLIDRRRARFGSVAAQLEALSPLSVLSRGYALATTAAGRILLNAKDVSAGDEVTVRLSRGRLKTTVIDREEET